MVQTCERFWDELKRYVFTGEVRIYVPDREGKRRLYSPESARRFFSGYEHCKDGTIPCDHCGSCFGKKPSLVACQTCFGKKSSLLACRTCFGVGAIACGSCQGLGSQEDTSWIAQLVPPDSVKELIRALDAHGIELDRWLAERGRISDWKRRILRELNEAPAAEDPQAVLEEDFVTLSCPRCKGKGLQCSDCWGSGKREFYAGTPEYERFAATALLKGRLTDLDNKLNTEFPSASIPVEFPASMQSPPSLPLFPVTEREIDTADLPEEMNALLREGDAHFEEGKRHFTQADPASNPVGWIEAAHLSVSAF